MVRPGDYVQIRTEGHLYSGILKGYDGRGRAIVRALWRGPRLLRRAELKTGKILPRQGRLKLGELLERGTNG